MSTRLEIERRQKFTGKRQPPQSPRRNGRPPVRKSCARRPSRRKSRPIMPSRGRLRCQGSETKEAWDGLLYTAGRLIFPTMIVDGTCIRIWIRISIRMRGSMGGETRTYPTKSRLIHVWYCTSVRLRSSSRFASLAAAMFCRSR